MSISTYVACATVAGWATAVLSADVGIERAIDAFHRCGFEPTIALATEPQDVPTRFAIAIGRWRSAGIGGWRYVPVVPAQTPGLPDPPHFRARAMDAGAALVSATGPTVGLVPLDLRPRSTRGSTSLLELAEIPTTGRAAEPPDSLSDLDHALLLEVRAVTALLQEQMVGRWQRDVDDLLAQWDAVPEMPPSTPKRAQRLAARSERVLAMVDLALSDQAGGSTASEMHVRAAALRGLGRTARSAHAAAWNTALSRPPAAR